MGNMKLKFIKSCFISGIIVSSCNPANTSDSAGKNSLSVDTPSDTLNVEAGYVKKGLFVNETWCNGSLQAWQKAIVPFEIQGNILKVNIVNGQQVTAGQLLAQLDDYRQQQNLKEAELNFEQALLNFEDQLLLSGYRSDDTVRIPKTLMRMAKIRSGLTSAELALQKSRRELQNTRITAPVSGLVAGLSAQAFTPVSEYKYFCMLLNSSKMAATFRLLETDAALVKPGINVKVMPVALPGKSFAGVITEIDPSLGENGFLQVTARVENVDGLLLDGMKIKVVVNAGLPGQIIVPKTAVLARQNRQVVFTVENGRAIWNYVTTGFENSTQYTITEGLTEGQLIITGNNLTIGHEAPVIVKKANP